MSNLDVRTDSAGEDTHESDADSSTAGSDASALGDSTGPADTTSLLDSTGAAQVDSGATDSGAADSGTSTDGSGDANSGPGKQVLIFYGHAGVGTDGIFGYGVHKTLAKRYQTAGLQVTYSASWPADLSTHRLIILAVPGYGDDTDLFADNEVTALKAWLKAGGVLYVENEKTAYSGTVVINDLLQRLGSGISQQDDTIGSGGMYGVLTASLGKHTLLAGVSKLGFGEGSLVVPKGATVLVSYKGDCVMAAEAFGKGLLIVSGDQQFLDDHGLKSFPPDGAHNLAFADNLAQL